MTRKQKIIIGLVVLLLAVSVGGYFVYKHWDTITGWFKKEEVQAPPSQPDDPIELTYQVTFNLDGSLLTQTVKAGECAIPEVVSSSGNMTFLGWSIDGETVVDVATYPILEDTTFIALFDEICIEQPVQATSATCFTFEDGTVTGYTGEETDVVIPSTYSLDDEGNPIDGTDIQVTAIGSKAFYEKIKITSVVIPEGVTEIMAGNSQTGAFKTCYNMTSVTLPSTLTTIGAYAFRNCSKLASIELPSELITIGGSAFMACTGLTSIEIPDKVTGIGTSAFNGCTGLTSIEISDNVQTLGASVFQGCTALTRIILGSGVQTLGTSPFMSCTSLEEILIYSENVITVSNSLWVPTDCEIYVLDSLQSSYKAASYWKDYSSQIYKMSEYEA